MSYSSLENCTSVSYMVRKSAQVRDVLRLTKTGRRPDHCLYCGLAQVTASMLSVTVIDKTEYWFLDVVVEMEWPLWILTDPEMETHLNRRGHGLAYPDLVDILERMFQNGDLGARYPSDNTNNTTQFIPTRTEIEASLGREGVELWFALTEQGAVRWETISQPNWDRYLADSYWIDDTDVFRGEIISPD